MFVKVALLVVLGVACGQVYADEADSVVGGTNAQPGEFPYQVSLRAYGQHFCGGTLITNQHVVTAAHCIEGVVSPPWNNFQVVTGTTTLNAGGQTHRVKNVQVHPNYMNGRQWSWANDAALITLAQPITPNSQQYPIPMATSDPPVNAPLQLSGWGKTSTNGGIPNNLQKAMVFYVSNDQCAKAHQGMTINPSHICAFRAPGIGACQGDSGGPLVYQGKLVGITSWVLPCARGVPDVYTRVTHMQAFFGRALRN